jgi:hypothetical protein
MDKKKRIRSDKRILKTSITIRCTPAYKAMLNDVAELVGVSVGTYIRDRLGIKTDIEKIENARSRPKREPVRIGFTDDALKVAEAAADISRVMTSLQKLEQAVLTLSKSGKVSKQVLTDIENTIAENQECVRNVMTTLMPDYDEIG